jgi:phage shock protein A
LRRFSKIEDKGEDAHDEHNKLEQEEGRLKYQLMMLAMDHERVKGQIDHARTDLANANTKVAAAQARNQPAVAEPDP